MNQFSSIVIAKNTIADKTILLTTTKPDDFTFTAGQFVKLIMPGVTSTDPLANWRWFSIASAPSEDNLLFCCREGDSEFKNTLEQLRPGDTIGIAQLSGKFCLKPNVEKPIVFLVGGVGITPVRSMIIETAIKKQPYKMTLLYSNYRPEDTAFKQELDALGNPNLTIIYTMTEPKKSKEVWKGETGFIDIEMIKRYVPDITQPYFYIVGSPGFCKVMVELLEKNVVPKENIVLEKFTGL